MATFSTATEQLYICLAVWVVKCVPRPLFLNVFRPRRKT